VLPLQHAPGFSADRRFFTFEQSQDLIPAVNAFGHSLLCHRQGAGCIRNSARFSPTQISIPGGQHAGDGGVPCTFADDGGYLMTGIKLTLLLGGPYVSARSPPLIATN
jgi:hypothetical protein